VWVFKEKLFGQEQRPLEPRHCAVAALSNAATPGRMMNQTSPRRTKFANNSADEVHTKGSNLNFGEFGLQAQEPAWYRPSD